MESSAHRAGKPDDSNSLISKSTDNESMSSVIGFEEEATPYAWVQAHAKGETHSCAQ